MARTGCPECGSGNLSERELRDRTYVQCLECGHLWHTRRGAHARTRADSRATKRRGRTAAVIAIAVVVISALGVGGVALYGTLTRGNPTALLPFLGPKGSPSPTGPGGETSTPSDADYQAALAVLAQDGYTLHVEHAWGENDTLHVLIGDHPGAPGSRDGERAFLFVGAQLVGMDSSQDSAGITVTDHTDRALTVAYQLYAPSDPVAQPSLGVAKVRFAWDGTHLSASGPIPTPDWSSADSRRGTPIAASPAVRPIIFIPGIEGSYLTDAAGNETWPDSQGLFDHSCIHLVLAYVDSGCESRLFHADAFDSNGNPPVGDPVDVGNGVNHPLDSSSGSADPPLGGALTTVNTNALFGLGDTSTHYYDITAELARQAGYTVVQSDDTAGLNACAGIKRCFIPIGIDWRRSAGENADRVFAVIQQVLAITGSDRVDLLAHSQGGLIANALVHEPQAVGKIYRTVTLGTPYLGAPKALAVLLYQEPCIVGTHYFGCPLDPGVVQQLVKNYPGAAELLPSEAYFEAAPESPLVVGGIAQPLTYQQAQSTIAALMAAAPLSSTTALIGAAQSFHSSVDTWSPLDSSVGLVRMVGYDSGAGSGCYAAPCTAAEVGSYDAAATTVSIDTTGAHQIYSGTGDGTVPLYSASLYNPAHGFDDRGAGRNLYWCAVSHFGLAWSTPVWSTSESYLEGTTSYTADAVGPGGTCPGGTIGSVAPLLPTGQ